MVGLIMRDHAINNPLDRIQRLEARVEKLERLLNAALLIIDAGNDSDSTQAGWIEVEDGYIHVYASK